MTKRKYGVQENGCRDLSKIPWRFIPNVWGILSCTKLGVEGGSGRANGCEYGPKRLIPRLYCLLRYLQWVGIWFYRFRRNSFDTWLSNWFHGQGFWWIISELMLWKLESRADSCCKSFFRFSCEDFSEAEMAWYFLAGCFWDGKREKFCKLAVLGKLAGGD